MAMVLAFGEKMVQISAYGSQAERSLEAKLKFYDELAGEYEPQNLREIGQGDFNGHVGEEM